MWFAVIPATNKFIYSDSKGKLIGLANNIWYGEKFMILSESGFNEVYSDQIQKGNKMTEVIIRTERQQRSYVPKLPPLPIPQNDADIDIIEPKETMSERAMRRLSKPQMMSAITMNKPYSKPNYRR